MVEQNLNLRRAIFVYEGARLEAEISARPIVPEPWDKRDEAFKTQFVKVVDRQCSADKFSSAEVAHDSWWREYERMGWQYGPERDTEKKRHPDMMPFNYLPKSERDKDEIFLRLCAVAEAISDC
jgi:hypothetical protein